MLSILGTALELFVVDQNSTEVYSDEASASEIARQPLQASRPPIVKYKGKSVLKLIREIFIEQKVVIMMRCDYWDSLMVKTMSFTDKAGSKIKSKVIYYSFEAFFREIY